MNFTQTTQYPSIDQLAQQWVGGCRTISQGRFWQGLLMAIGVLSNLFYTCTLPFVCLGVIAGMTLPRRRALVTATTIWFANQLFGYTLHHYPRTFNTAAWGLVLLVGTLLVTLLASHKPLFRQGKVLHHYLRLSGMLVVGFVLFELVIVLAGLFLGGVSGFTPPILWGIFASSAIWLAGLTIAHGFLVWDKIVHTFSPKQPLSSLF